MHPCVTLGDDVAAALREARPVVALESTIFSSLGLPAPANGEALERCIAAVRGGGAVPALTGVLDGRWCVGVTDNQAERLLAARCKVAERDLAPAAARRLDVGVTTVSATAALAALAGVAVFSTGGIGGVHRDSDVTGDVSADLDALAAHPVVTVCAGAKAFLDLPRTLEVLESIGVPVLGWRHDWFPAFYTRSSGVRVHSRVESAQEVADVLRFRVRARTGVLLTVPIPERDELPGESIAATLTAALDACRRDGVVGAAITPYVLARIEVATAGRSVAANLALAENNARVAAEVAAAVASS